MDKKGCGCAYSYRKVTPNFNHYFYTVLKSNNLTMVTVCLKDGIMDLPLIIISVMKKKTA